MRRAHRLNLHLHSDKEARRSTKARRRRRPGDLPQTRHSLFFIVTRREAITLSLVGMQRHAHFVEINTIVR
jgi:hypothetical protein